MKSFRFPIFGTLTAALAAIGLSIASEADAAYTVTLSQVGNDVVANGSGTLNLADLTPESYASGGSFIWAAHPSIGIGPSGYKTKEDYYYGPIVGPTNFGTGGAFDANTGSGELVEMVPPNAIYVYTGYVSGSQITNSATWTDTTFIGLGLKPGTYTWTWGSAENADSFTLIIGRSEQNSIPTLGVWGLTSLASLMAIAALVTLRRRRQSSMSNRIR
jgi:hypothetical protein